MDGLLNLLLEVHTRAVAGGPPAFVERARRTMREQLAAPLRLSDLAMGAAMSPGAFGRLYRRASGMTPITDLRRLRLEAARDLIKGTGLPLKAIAERTGFCDQYHLGRCFRRCFRVPPGFFRRRSWPR